jgi:F420-0:gamma-glutamyl ligase
MFSYEGEDAFAISRWLEKTIGTHCSLVSTDFVGRSDRSGTCFPVMRQQKLSKSE